MSGGSVGYDPVDTARRMKSLLPLLVLSAGCKAAVDLPRTIMGQGAPVAQKPPIVIQAEVMRFADHYAAAVAQASDEFRERVPTAEARSAAQTWKLREANAAWTNAANPNPLINALDMVVLATLSRMVQEDFWSHTYGESAAPLLETHRKLEWEAWIIVEKLLKPPQLEELRAVIADWRAKNPDQRQVTRTSLSAMAEVFGDLPAEKHIRTSNLLGLLMIDPLAGLDPAARAIEQTRTTAERSLYYFQRLSTVLSWQAELLVFEVTTTTEAKQVLDSTKRLTEVAERLPDLIEEQREAAIQQVFENLGAEDERLGSTIVELRQALSAGNEMAKSVDGAIKSFDGLMDHFSSEPGNEPASEPAPTTSESRPFDILDYAKTASEIGAAAKELNAATVSLDKTWPRVERAGEALEKAGTRLADRLFLVGAGLIAFLVIGAVTGALFYRRLTGRERRRQAVTRGIP